MGNQGFWNRQSRRSGGYCPSRSLIGEATQKPPFSIQCFEGRHAECLGDCKPFMPDPCVCDCHKRHTEKRGDEEAR
jgi:hypothetical protein